MTDKLRLWGDHNNGPIIWVLQYDGQPIDVIGKDLGLREGLPVTVWDDGGEPDSIMEMDGYLTKQVDFEIGDGDIWLAVCDASTLRSIPSA